MNISLLVTSFNRGRLFEKSLESILPQLEPQDEIVVVNDGPLDAMPQILNGISKCQTTYLDTGNRHYRGGAIAKNIGLKATKNQLVVIHDPEIVNISPCINYIKIFFTLAREKNVFLIPGSMYFAKDAQNATFKESNFIGHSQAPFIGGILRTSLFAVGGWDERFVQWGNEDNDLMHRLGQDGVQMLCDESMVAFHQWHDRPPQSVMGDCNEGLLHEKNKPIIANQGKEWGVI